MNTPEDVGLVFLVIVRNYWHKSPVLADAKATCRREGKWERGEKRKFRTFLVHEDTTITEMGDITYPNQAAADTALDLGEL